MIKNPNQVFFLGDGDMGAGTWAGKGCIARRRVGAGVRAIILITLYYPHNRYYNEDNSHAICLSDWKIFETSTTQLQNC